jgi:hypothetical protein
MGGSSVKKIKDLNIWFAFHSFSSPILLGNQTKQDYFLVFPNFVLSAWNPKCSAKENTPSPYHETAKRKPFCE